MFELSSDSVMKVAERAGIDRFTAQSLLRQGWTYVEEIGKPPTWVKRSAIVVEQRNER